MTIPKGIALILFCTGLGGYGIAEAGFASKLADTHKFRLSYAVGTMHRDLRGSEFGIPDTFEFDGPYEFIRAGYGITDRIRLSLDIFGYRQRSKQTGNMVDHVAAFGGCLQGTLVSLGMKTEIDASGGYWELHEAHVYSWGPKEITEVERAFSLVLRQSVGRGLSAYAGPIYNHFRYEYSYVMDYSPENGSRYNIGVTDPYQSHRDIGLVGGAEGKIWKHLILNAEGTYTGDWGLTGEIGWEF